ncbi:MAG: GntR family transcriptional regulator [Enterobacterales bacterium]|nr:GntR family transcriptional regulator [Enterobacterales bacterium]
MDPVFILSQKDSRPMYLQIIEQIKTNIATNDWPQGFKLPSIRELAVSLRVSVITVKRAYQELENEQVIYTQQGKGSYVADGENMGLKLKQVELDKQLVEALKTAKILGMSTDDINVRIHSLVNDSNIKLIGEGDE